MIDGRLDSPLASSRTVAHSVKRTTLMRIFFLLLPVFVCLPDIDIFGFKYYFWHLYFC